MVTGEGTKDVFKIGWFIEKDYASIREPAIKSFPSLGLSHHLIGSHDCMGGEQAQQADLRYAAETNTRFTFNFFKPSPGDVMVDVPSVGEGDPHIHIREKE
jgi:hypothetical protein